MSSLLNDLQFPAGASHGQQSEHLAAMNSEELFSQARDLRDLGHGNIISYSRKVFIPLTRLCRDFCHYCTFATTPKLVSSPYMNADEVVALAQSGMPRRMTRWIYRLDGRNGATDTIAKIAFCHGVFQSNYSPDEARRKRDFIRNFAGEFWPNHSWPEKIKARFAEAGAAFQLLRDQT